MAIDGGNPKSTNIVMLGAFVGASGIVAVESVEQAVSEKLSSKKDVLEINLRLLAAGYELARSSAPSRSLL
jgi:Pyruvate/2-oxoacid:ferredoxin oxidoreductase gamma subunit